MAEAAVQSPTGSNAPKYFCHKCSVSVDLSPELPDLTCPRCESGFIEELTKELQEQHAARTESSPQMLFRGAEMPNFLSNLRLTSLDDHSDHEDDDWDDEDEEEYALVPPRYSHDRRLFRRRRTRGRSPLSPSETRGTFPRFLEDLFRELTGGSSSRTPSFLPLFWFHGDPRDYAWGADGLDNAITQLLNQWECPGATPASKDDIERLEPLTISHEHIENEMQCSICMEDFNLNEAVLSLPCQHLFHNDCIKPWLDLHNTCPICRKTLGDGTVPDVATADVAATSLAPQTATDTSDDSSSGTEQRPGAVAGAAVRTGFERGSGAAGDHMSDGEEKKDIDKPTADDQDATARTDTGRRYFTHRTTTRNERIRRQRMKMPFSGRHQSASSTTSTSSSSTDDYDTP